MMKTNVLGTLLIINFLLPFQILRSQSGAEIDLPILNSYTSQEYLSADGNYYYRVNSGNPSSFYRWDLRTGALDTKATTNDYVYFFGNSCDTVMIFPEKSTIALLKFGTKDTVRKFADPDKFNFWKYGIRSPQSDYLVAGYNNAFEVYDGRKLESTEYFFDAQFEKQSAKYFFSENSRVFSAEMDKKILLFFPERKYLFISKVDSSGAAFQCGMRKGDLVIRANGADMQWAINPFKNKALEITVIRGTETLNIKLDKRESAKFGFENYLWPNVTIDKEQYRNMKFRFAANEDLLVLNSPEKKYVNRYVAPDYFFYSVSAGKITDSLLCDTAVHYRVSPLNNYLKVDRTTGQYPEEKREYYLLDAMNVKTRVNLPEKIAGMQISDSYLHKHLLFVKDWDKNEVSIYNFKKNKIVQRISWLSLTPPKIVKLNPRKTEIIVDNKEVLTRIDFSKEITRRAEPTGTSDRIEALQYDSSGKFVLCGFSNGLLKWDMEKEKQVYLKNLGQGNAFGLNKMVSDADLVKTLYSYSHVNGTGFGYMTKNLEEPECKLYMHTHKEFPPPDVTSFQYDRKNAEYVYVGLADGQMHRVKINELQSFEDNLRYSDYFSRNEVIKIIQDKKYQVLAGFEKGGLKVYTPDLSASKEYALHDTTMVQMILAPKQDLLLSSDEAGNLVKRAWPELSSLWSVKFPFVITDMEVSWDEKFIVASCSDGAIRFLDLKTGSEIVTLWFFQLDDHFLLTTPDGYFYGSKEVVKQIKFKKDGQVITGSELEVTHNRPDIILERLGYAKPELIEKLRKLWKKRMKKAGLNNTEGSAIRVVNVSTDILNSDKAATEVLITINDPLQQADELFFYHNGALIKKMKWYGTERASSKKMTAELITGDNNFSCYLTDKSGKRSHNFDFCISQEDFKTAAKSRFYFIGLASNRYADSSMNLKYAEKDIKDVSKTFESSCVKSATEYNQLLLTGDELKTNALGKIREFVKEASAADVIVVDFAGHGVLNGNMDYFLSTSGTDFRSPENGSLPIDSLENILNGTKAVNRLLFLDACHSGEIDKDEIKVKETKTEIGKSIVFRGNNNLSSSGLQNENMLMNQFFDDVRISGGMNVISSSEGAEFSLESDQWQNGLFTYALKGALSDFKADLNKDNCITVSELSIYLNAEVSKLSKGIQKPGTRYINPSNDFVILKR
jgi:WD40 repeat protein